MLRTVFLSALMVTQAVANEAPPVPEGGLLVLSSFACSDDETQENGDCYLLQDLEGNTFLAFWQEDELMFIRQIVGDTYKSIWVNDTYNTY